MITKSILHKNTKVFEFSENLHSITKSTCSREITTYEYIRSEEPQLAAICPEIMSIDKSKKTIEMQNLVYRMQEPVMFDVKLGSILYNSLDREFEKQTTHIDAILKIDPDYFTDEERQRKSISKARKMKWRMVNTTSKDLAMNLCRFSYKLLELDHSEIFLYQKEDIRKFMTDFFDRIPQSRKIVVEKLLEIIEVLKQSKLFTKFVPIHSSICVFCDVKNPCDVRVKFLDFGKSYPIQEFPEDDQKLQSSSILRGIKNLEQIIESSSIKRSKTKPFNDFDFNAIDNEVIEMEKEMANNDVDFFFSQLYKNASDDTKRAMQKSFEQSKGSVLSTNWNEVKDKDITPYKSEPASSDDQNAS